VPKAVENVLEADSVATTVRSFSSARAQAWAGTAAELLAALNEAAGERVTKAKEWPKNPRAVSGRLRRAAPALRKVGVQVTFDREGKARDRKIEITATPASPEPEQEGKFASFASGASASKDFNDLGRTQRRTQTEVQTDVASAGDSAIVGADASGPGDAPTVRLCVRPNPLKNKAADGADDADAKIPTQSGPETPGWKVRL
jgi:hypothetical protein